MTPMQTVPKHMVCLGQAGPLSQEITWRESNMLEVSRFLGKTRFFIAVPKRKPLNFLFVVVLLPADGSTPGGDDQVE